MYLGFIRGQIRLIFLLISKSYFANSKSISQLSLPGKLTVELVLDQNLLPILCSVTNVTNNPPQANGSKYTTEIGTPVTIDLKQLTMDKDQDRLKRRNNRQTFLR